MFFSFCWTLHATSTEPLPCFARCDHDFTSEVGSHGSIQISGDHAAVSDITPAAGWFMASCDPSAADQDIRLVCQEPDKGCDHVFMGGAEGTVVRLPNGCGPMPFAVITRVWNHEDQSIPAVLRLEGASRGSLPPVVRGMTLSTRFSDVGMTNGNVRFSLIGASIPNVSRISEIEAPIASGVSRRSVTAWIESSLRDIAHAHTAAIGGFNKSTTGTSRLDYGKTFAIFNETRVCQQQGVRPAFNGQFTVDVGGKVVGNVSYGVSISGSILPPEVDGFGLFVGLDAVITGTLGINASLTGTLASDKIPLVIVGIPALNIPRILSIGPTFRIDAQATASIDTNLAADINVAYAIQGAQLFFTSHSFTHSGNFTSAPSDVNLSFSPDVTTHAQIAAHLLPSLNFGIDLLGGKAQATVHLTLDADTSTDLSLIASADIPFPKAVSKLDTSAKKCKLRPGTTRTGSMSASGGCVDISSGLSVTAGIDADLFDFLKKGKSVSLFNERFDLYKKCFGDSVVRKSYVGRSVHAQPLERSERLVCPAKHVGPVQSMIKNSSAG
ncbi:hypothetical protein C8Q70DRAFT_1130587 [Cubamyces menziesii]|nr:hypothetical protein C8Q70DRAFT_1130587 [Cubamyces menziesii]